MMEVVVDAMVKEIRLRTDYLSHSPLSTIYWGGGTPSTLNHEGAKKIMQCIKETFQIDRQAEITIEVNPDDVTPENAYFWRQLGFNRVSMGVQSFDDNILHRINRRHNAKQAKAAVEILQSADFRNISLDLIYGLPLQDMSVWQQDVITATQLGIQHISSYGLTFEPDTLLYKMMESGQVKEQEDDVYNEMYDFLCDYLKKTGFEHYEVSNFSLPGFASRHNSSYWNDIPYLGIGPGAHSYDGNSRQWNVEQLGVYVDKINQDVIPCDLEYLTVQQQWEEYVMLRLRTKDGIDLHDMKERFGDDNLKGCLKRASFYLEQDSLCLEKDHLYVTRKGVKILNRIISDLIG